MIEQVNLYAGFDAREEVGFHAFVSTVLHLSSLPVCIVPIGKGVFDGLHESRNQQDGSTAFTYTRFLIPWMMGFKGWALFCDGSDMILRADVAELWRMRDHYKAVQVVQHDYKTRHPRKFVDTPLETSNRDYARKNWSSVMLINCGHFAWRDLYPEVVSKMSGEDLHQFKFIRDDHIGMLPVEWNWLVDEYGADEGAKLLHWTAGIPAFPYYAFAPMADEWARAALDAAHVEITAGESS